MATYDDFLKLDIRVGRIVKAEEFPEARKPMYRLTIDFGEEMGTKTSCAQITHNYKLADLKDKQVIGVVNFPPRQIGSVASEVLTLGLADDKDHVVLLSPDTDVPLGGRLY